MGVGPSPAVEPGPGEIQIAISYVGICGTDLHILHGTMDHRVSLPQLIGHEMSGTVKTAGEGVHDFSPGQKVVVRPLVPCLECGACLAGHQHICHRLIFLGIDAPGALQTEWTVPANLAHVVPDSVPLRTAALIEPMAVACHDVRRGEVVAGEKVVVMGAGPIGLLISMVSRHKGAEVIASDPNPTRMALARDLGFEAVAPGDLEAAVARIAPAGADVVFEVSGAAAAVATATGLLRTRGRLVIVGIHSEPHPVDLFRVFWRELAIVGARVYEPQDFEEAIALIADGSLAPERLITSVVPLDELEAALDMLQSGGDAVKVLVALGGNA